MHQPRACLEPVIRVLTCSSLRIIPHAYCVVCLFPLFAALSHQRGQLTRLQPLVSSLRSATCPSMHVFRFSASGDTAASFGCH